MAETVLAEAHPNYVELVKFLVKPFLEAPDSLKVDCEISHSRAKVWLRLAFEGADKGRVFGRGGRNIQAIRSVLEAAALAAGYSAHLDVYGSQSQSREDSEDGPIGRPTVERSHVERPQIEKPTIEKSPGEKPQRRDSKELPRLRSKADLGSNQDG